MVKIFGERLIQNSLGEACFNVATKKTEELGP
jgi:hypothetical protein